MRRRWPIALVVYALVAAALLAPSIRPGRTVVPVDILEAVEPFHSLPPQQHVHEPAPSDVPLQFLGWWTWMGRELRTGHVPQWNPDVLGGVPVEPNGFVSPSYPLTWFDRYLAPFDAYNAFVWAHFVIAAMGVYAFARRLGARFGAALVGGLGAFVVAMFVHLSTHVTHAVAIAWAGLLFAGVHYAVRERSLRGCVAVAAPLAATWLGGGAQFAYYATLAAGGYGAVLALADGDGWRALWPRAARLAAGVTLGLALAAPVLLPTLRAGNSILRSREPVASTTQTHLPVADGLRLVLPGWRTPDGFAWGHTENLEYAVDSPFVGVVAVILAAGSIVVARRRRDVAVTIAAAAVVVLLAFLGPIHRLLYDGVPGYDHFRNSSRWISLFGWFVLPLAAVGLDAVVERSRAATRAVAIAAGAVAVVALGPVAVGVVRTSVPARALASDSLFVVALAAVIAACALLRARVLLVVAAALMLVEGVAHTTTWYGAHRERTALPRLSALTASPRSGRLIRYTPELTQLPPLPADVPLAYGLSDASGWAVFLPRDIDAYMNRVEAHGDFARRTNVEPPLTTAAALTSPLLDALNVTTVLVDPGITGPLPLSPIGHIGPVKILRRPNALGPAVLEGNGGTVRRTQATADTERYAVHARRRARLRVAGRYDAGWRATIDGHRAKVQRTRGIFRSVVVPAGDHTVAWRYRNAAARTGKGIAAVAAAACVALLITRRRRSAI